MKAYSRMTTCRAHSCILMLSSLAQTLFIFTLVPVTGFCDHCQPSGRIKNISNTVGKD